MTKPKPFREGDLVRVVDPRRVLRVGYPKSLDDYAKEIEEKFSERICGLIRDAGRHPTWRLHSEIIGLVSFDKPKSKAYRRILAELAHEAAVTDKFGGPERSIHFVDIPEALGEIGVVSRLKTVKTGIYYPACGSHNSYVDDWEPGGLRDEKTHRLASVRLSLPVVSPIFEETWFPVAHLEHAGSRYLTAEEWRAQQEQGTNP